MGAITPTLYIFEPHEWPYCGGHILIIHWSLDQAIALFKEQNPNEGDVISDDKEVIEKTGSCGHGWLLTETITVVGEEPRVVSVNYQYA